MHCNCKDKTDSSHILAHEYFSRNCVLLFVNQVLRIVRKMLSLLRRQCNPHGVLLYLSVKVQALCMCYRHSCVHPSICMCYRYSQVFTQAFVCVIVTQVFTQALVCVIVTHVFTQAF